MSMFGISIGELDKIMAEPLDISPVGQFEFRQTEQEHPFLHSIVLDKSYARMSREYGMNQVSNYLGVHIFEIRFVLRDIRDDIMLNLYSKKHDLPGMRELMIYSSPTNLGGVEFIDSWGMFKINNFDFSIGLEIKKWDACLHFRTNVRVILA